MAEDIDYALIAFINERPEGNLLRDIAIQTLKDLQRRNECYVFPEENEPKIYRTIARIKEPLQPREHLRVNRSEINVYVRKNLKKLRNKSQMFKVDFANKFNIDQSTYRKYENGDNSAPPDLIINVCRAFDVSVEKFMTELI